MKGICNECLQLIRNGICFCNGGPCSSKHVGMVSDCVFYDKIRKKRCKIQCIDFYCQKHLFRN